MSQLKLFVPPIMAGAFDPDEGPTLISFRTHAKRLRSRRYLRILQRARTLHENRSCPSCGCASVDPIELRDALFNRNRLPVPGTATLVGFHCQTCRSEWPIGESEPDWDDAE